MKSRNIRVSDETWKMLKNLKYNAIYGSPAISMNDIISQLGGFYTTYSSEDGRYYRPDPFYGRWLPPVKRRQIESALGSIRKSEDFLMHVLGWHSKSDHKGQEFIPQGDRCHLTDDDLT